jgi:hypothetical protein
MLVKQIFETLNILNNKINQYELILMRAAKRQDIKAIQNYNLILENANNLKTELENYDLTNLNTEEFEHFLMRVKVES